MQAAPFHQNPGKRFTGTLPHLRSFVLIMALIFSLELLIMGLLPFIAGEQDPIFLSFLDAALLTAACSPFIWLIIAAPLKKSARMEREWGESLINMVNDGIVILDRRTVILTINSAAKTIFKCSTGDVSGKPFNHLVSIPAAPDDGLSGDLGQDTFVAATGWRKDGSSFPLEISVSSLSRNDMPVIVVILRDITERKEAEQSLQEKNAELESFLYTVSHDLKTPVVTISLFLDAIQACLEKGDTAQAIADMHYLQNATDKMGQLLEGVLALSKAGRFLTAPEKISYQGLVKMCTKNMSEAISARKVTLTVSSEDLDLYGDKSRLISIWHNLLDNAVKFLGSQTDPRISIGYDTTDAGPVFFVRDNGIGIDLRYQNKIFKLFEQLDPGCGGDGLGLTIANRIVELYSGKLWVESVGAGQGACFRFTLPGALAGTGPAACAWPRDQPGSPAAVSA